MWSVSSMRLAHFSQNVIKSFRESGSIQRASAVISGKFNLDFDSKRIGLPILEGFLFCGVVGRPDYNDGA